MSDKLFFLLQTFIYITFIFMLILVTTSDFPRGWDSILVTYIATIFFLSILIHGVPKLESYRILRFLVSLYALYAAYHFFKYKFIFFSLLHIFLCIYIFPSIGKNTRYDWILIDIIYIITFSLSLNHAKKLFKSK